MTDPVDPSKRTSNPEARAVAPADVPATERNTPSRTASQSPQSLEPIADSSQLGSMTLVQLPSSRKPSPSTVCEICPASMWYATPKTVRCYCRVMRLISWSTDEPTEMTHCDGMHLASQEQLQV